MYKQFMAALVIAGLFGGLSACVAPGTQFPQTENPEIETAEQFDTMAASINNLKDKRIKIAGEKIRFDETDDGLLVTAKWLPYPSDDLHFSESPASRQQAEKEAGSRRFTFIFPVAKDKSVDPLVTWRGNKFILLADISGVKSVPTSLTGKLSSVPHLVGHCIRVWKTGGSKVSHSPDTEFTAFPPMARTYCAD